MSERLCIVCGWDREDQAQTCLRCLSRTRSAISEIVELYGELPAELVGHAGAARPPDAVGSPDSDGLPEALVLLAGGTNGNVIGGRPTIHEPDGNRDHAADQWPTDTPSVLGVLATWEDDWRGPNVAQREATVANCAGYLLEHLHRQAQQHPAFDEFAHGMWQLRDQLKVALRKGDPTERGVECPYCGDRLVRQYVDEDSCACGPRPRHRKWYDLTYNRDIYLTETARWEARHQHCEQGGRREDWVCSNRDCGRVFDVKRYNLAVWFHWHRRQAG